VDASGSSSFVDASGSSSFVDASGSSSFVDASGSSSFVDASGSSSFVDASGGSSFVDVSSFELPQETLNAFVTELNDVYDPSANLVDLQASFEDIILNGNEDGTLDGLADLTSLDVSNYDLNGTNPGSPTIQSVVSDQIEDGMEEYNSEGNSKTLDDIFKETIEDTIEELQDYNPDIFSSS
jgi:hypothetical protein